jgi:hypothetical protein
MAFGKKKPRDEEVSATAAAVELPPDAEGDAIDSEMFASTNESPEAGVEPAADDAATEAAAIEPAAEEAPAAGDPLSSGPDLLSMFQTTEAVSDDRAALLELAGEVELDDLLEDLQTVRSAIGRRAR